MTRKAIKLAGRKWKRQFEESAVAQSLLKALTEPITNSYDSYRRQSAAAERSTGLVDAMLEVKVGTHLVHGELIKSLPSQSAKRIYVSINRTRATGRENKECRILDSAEGMTAVQLEEKFASYGEEKSGAGVGKGVRGLFGQGLCDVLFSHSPGEIRSIVDGEAARCEFSWGPNEQPQYEVVSMGRATAKIRSEWGIKGNGTQIVCQLSERCRVPQQDESVVAKLANFYMLRLINADPSASVIVGQTRRDGTAEQRLQYEFPHGQVVKRFTTSFKFRSYEPIKIDGIVVRADTALPTKEAADERGNGFLIVDDADTVYDQTFFSKYEPSLYLEHVYGVIRLSNIRDVIRDCLNKGEALVTETRDGFDTSKELYRELEAAVLPHVDAVLRKEVDRASTSESTLSGASEKKVKKALSRLNDLFQEVTKEDTPGTGGGGNGVAMAPKTIAFEVERLQLTVDRSRRIRLLGNTAVVAAGTPVLFDGDPANLKVEPESATWRPVVDAPGVLAVAVTVTADRIGLIGQINALAQTVDGEAIGAVAHIVDTIPPLHLLPPESGIEFRPPFATSVPSRRGHLALIVDPTQVPLGCEILLSADGKSAVRLINEKTGEDAISFSVTLDASHLIPGTAVSRIAVAFRGSGYGQKAVIRADCFVGATALFATAEVMIKETNPNPGGVFKKVEYRDLPGGMAKSASEFDRSNGEIIVNRLHPINRSVFGADKISFEEAFENSIPAQSRLAEVIVDQCLYHTLATAHQNGQISLKQDDTIGAMRRKIDEFKYENAEPVYRELVSGFRVPRIDA